MSNKFRSSFSPGRNFTSSNPSKISVLKPHQTVQPQISKGFSISYTDTSKFIHTESYRKNMRTKIKAAGKPIKPNTGSMDRLNKIKAIAMKR